MDTDPYASGLNGRTPAQARLLIEHQWAMFLKRQDLNPGAIGAFLNNIDVVITKKGPYVIENNPTPNFFDGDKEDFERLKKIVKSIVEFYNRTIN